MNHLDLYIERIISPMNLDGEQRNEMAQELRCHLDESVEILVNRGVSQQEAERTAMENFGDPKTIAARFGIWQGNAWRWFEGIMLTVMSSSAIWFSLRFNKLDLLELPAGWAFPTIYAMFFLIQHLWNRIQINGTLKIYRFLRPTQIIPFSEITSTRLERFRLFGVRRFIIHYGNKKASFTSAMPNAQCAAMALKALCPEALDEKTERLLERQLEPKTEGLPKRITLTIAGLISATLLGREIIRYPEGEGTSLGLPLALLLLLIIAFVQYYTVINRTKRGLFAMLTALLVISTYLMFGIATFSFSGFRGLEFFLLIATLLTLGLIWWNGRQRLAGLIMVSAIMLGSVLACFWLFLRPNPAWSYSIKTEGISESARWLADNPLKLLTLSTDRSETQMAIHTLYPDGSFSLLKQQALDSGNWTSLRPTTSSAILYFMRDYDKTEGSDSATKLRISDVYYLNDNDEPVKAATIRDTDGFLSSLMGNGTLISPDGKTMLLYSTQQMVGIYSFAEDKLTLFKHSSLQNFWRWSGDNIVEFIAPLAENTTNTRSVLRIDSQDMTSTVSQSLDFYDNFSPTVIKSREAMLFSQTSNSLDATGSDAVILWVNPDKGTSYTLSGFTSLSQKFDWNYELSLLAYVSNDEDNPSLILAGPEGKLDEVAIEKGFEAAWLSLSPDGQKVVYMDRRTEKWFWKLGRLRLWDREKKKLETITLETGIFTILQFLRHDSASSWRPVQWLPDGSGFLWAHQVPRHSPKGLDTQFYRYQFEK